MREQELLDRLIECYRSAQAYKAVGTCALIEKIIVDRWGSHSDGFNRHGYGTNLAGPVSTIPEEKDILKKGF